MTLYTSKTCGFCPTVKQYLKKFGAEYNEIDVTDSYEARLELQTKYQAQTVPVLVSESGDFMVGFNVPKLISMIKS